MKGQEHQDLLRCINEGRQYKQLLSQEACEPIQPQTFSMASLMTTLQIPDSSQDIKVSEPQSVNSSENAIGKSLGVQFLDDYEKFLKDSDRSGQKSRAAQRSSAHHDSSSFGPLPLSIQETWYRNDSQRNASCGYSGTPCQPDWREVLEGWLMAPEETRSSDGRRLSDVEESLEREKAERRASMDEYFMTWSKFYVARCLGNDELSSTNDLVCKDLEPLHAFADRYREYKFTTKESSRDETEADLTDGCSAYENGRLDEATEFFEKAVRKSCKSAEAWYRLGLAVAASGNDEQAIFALGEAIALDPSNRDAYLELVSCLVNEGLFSSACRTLCTWLCTDPELGAEARRLISEKRFRFFCLNESQKSLVCCSDLDDLRDVFSFVFRARERSGSAPISFDVVEVKENEMFIELREPCICLALVHVMAGRPEDAGRCLRRAIGAAGNKTKDPKLWNQLGVVMAEFGNYDEAADAFERALETWPDFHKARRNLDLLRVTSSKERHFI